MTGPLRTGPPPAPPARREGSLSDRDLVRLYWPVTLRPAFDALFAIDDAMRDVVAEASQPALAAIKLAWWREALERLDLAPPPAEPRLQAVTAELLPRGVSGEMLAGLEDGWAALLQEPVDHTAWTERGARLFAIGSILLGCRDSLLPDAGLLTSLIEGARRGYPVSLDAAESLRSGLARHRFPKELRPLTAFARLAARDVTRAGPPFEAEGSPGRALALIGHRLTGRL